MLLAILPFASLTSSWLFSKFLYILMFLQYAVLLLLNNLDNSAISIRFFTPDTIILRCFSTRSLIFFDSLDSLWGCLSPVPSADSMTSICEMIIGEVYIIPIGEDCEIFVLKQQSEFLRLVPCGVQVRTPPFLGASFLPSSHREKCGF